MKALQLFRTRGYDAVTVAEIAAGVGVSRRSFFRYFPTKEDLVFDWLTEQGEFVVRILRERPSTETAWKAMSATFLQLASYHDANAALTRLRTRLIFDTPSLSARYHQEHARWEEAFVSTLLLRRQASAREVFELRVQVASAITAFVAAIRGWAAAAAGGSLRPWVAAAFTAVSRTR